MPGSSTHPVADWQRRYEALRASFVDCQPAQMVAERFGFSAGYVRLLRHQFRHDTIDLSSPPPPEGVAARRRVNSETRWKIITLRHQRVSAGEIAELLHQEGVEVSIRTVERVLAEEGIPRLPRRTRLKIGLTVKGTEVPERAESLSLTQREGHRVESAGAGVFLFAPFIAQLHFDEIVRTAGLQQTHAISAESYLLSFLALKLLGTERYAHLSAHAFDPGLGIFAGLTALPKRTALSTYSYSLDEVHLSRLQEAFVQKASRLGFYEGGLINLDFHTVPHYGDESVLEEHRAAARGKRMKGALTLFAQNAQHRLILYTAADIHREEADEQVVAFLSFWRRIRRGVKPTLIF